jgi:hypothetical protein
MPLWRERPRSKIVCPGCRKIQPEHALENTFSLLELVQPLKAQSKSIHATEKRPIIDPAPGKQTIKVSAERQFADPNSHFVVPNRKLKPMVESKIAKVCMSIEATKIGLAEVHQDLVCAFNMAAVLAVIGLDNGVGKRIVWIRSRQHLPISNSGRDPHAMIGLDHSSIGSPSSPH